MADASMNADMTKEMIEEAREHAVRAFETESQEKAIATYIKTRIREEVQRLVALYCGEKLWLLCHT